MEAIDGSPDQYAYYMRFMVGGEAVEPNSLGMMKASFAK